MKPIFLAYEPGWKEPRQTGGSGGAQKISQCVGPYHLTILSFPSNLRKVTLQLGHHILDEVDKVSDGAVTGVKS